MNRTDLFPGVWNYSLVRKTGVLLLVLQVITIYQFKKISVKNDVEANTVYCQGGKPEPCWGLREGFQSKRCLSRI